MDKLRAMWLILRGRSVIYGVALKAAESGDAGDVSVKGGPWVSATAVRGGGVFFGGQSEIG